MIKGFLLPVRTNNLGFSTTSPYIPLALTSKNLSIKTIVLDTKASVDALPYEVGLQLGAIWREQTVPI